ncbi:D-glycero-beta-D-manno-heptose-1,7-bisphosphate 7-phosphatase [Lachnospiraceae bacterium]|nr:D-glycero-beta-D-manno-heptose-1,7-bisphosphate 7-phosphatase [Lachnospiraceae bacterium]
MREKIRKPAVFLDRDGVLAKEKSYVISVKDLEIFPYAAECVRKIHEKGYYAIVVTNQSGVARGMFTEEELQKMNDCLIKETGVDGVYYCPHHPEGKVKEYRKKCSCRKPGRGMFDAAGKDFDIDMQRSWMIGDQAGDIRAGKNLGFRTVLLESGYGTAGLEEETEPDYILNDLRNVLEVLE